MRYAALLIALLLGIGSAHAQLQPGVIGTGVTALPGAVAFRSGIVPTTQLAKMLASSTPTICVTGDSTATLTPNQLVYTDILYYNLTRRLREDNPTKTFTFQNFAISGQNYTTLDGVAGSLWPTWYFNTALPWLPYIQAANCTSVFINMGINDADGFLATAYQDVLNKITAWGTAPATWATGAKTFGTVIKDSNNKLEIVSVAGTSAGSAPTWATTVGSSTTDGTVTWQLLSAAAYVTAIPDIIMVTNPNTNPQAGPPYSTALNQQGTLAAASYQRNTVLAGGAGFNIASLPPLGMIDIGRYFTMLTQGIDPVVQVFTQKVGTPITGITTYPYTFPTTPGGDFDLSFTLSNGSTFTTGTAIQLTTSSPGTSAGSLLLFQCGGTGVTMSIYNGTGTTPVAVFVGGPFTSTNNTFEVIAKGEHLFVTVNGTVIYDGLTALFKNTFAPVLSFSGTALTTTMTFNYYNVGNPRPYSVMTTPLSCWGTTAGTNGNGINHDASTCMNYAVVSALEATRFVP